MCKITTSMADLSLRLFRHGPEPNGLAHRDRLERMKGDKTK